MVSRDGELGRNLTVGPITSIKGDPLGWQRAEYMSGNRRKKLCFTTNLATTVDVYSKSTLMTLLFDAIVDKQTT